MSTFSDPIILKYLKSKNDCLDCFLSASIDFALKAESGNLEELDAFQKKRIHMMKTLDLLDRKISEEAQGMIGRLRSDSIILEISQVMEKGEALIQSIGEAGARIIRSLQAEQDKLKQEILQNQRNSEKIGKFKSSWMPSAGDELDQKV